MSMMKTAASQPTMKRDEDTATNKSTNGGVDDSGISSSATTSELSFDPTRPKESAAELNNPLGYTIGATNALFKQRLYDDLDAFIDETDVDMRGNETLRKQLQLTTADLRFADYIIKNVQNMREKLVSQQSSAASGKQHGVKKTTSMNTFNPNTNNSLTNPDGSFNMGLSGDDEIASQAALAAMDFEGSDDWIRLNFKWYLYTMLASILKEDVCVRLKCELESMLFSWAGATSSASDTSQSGGDNSSSAGSCSLENEIVNIDEYIERVGVVSSNSNGSQQKQANDEGVVMNTTGTINKHDTLTPRKKVC